MPSADMATPAVELGRTLGSLLTGPYRILRGHRPLGLLALSYACAMLGKWLTMISLTVLAYLLTHSATTVGLLAFVSLTPTALFSPLVGLLIDRSEVKTLVMGANAGCALCLVGLTAVRTPATLWLAFPLVFLASTLASLIRPATYAALPDLVPSEELEQANNLLGQLDTVANIVAPVLSGLLFVGGHPALTFVIAAVTYGAAATVGGTLRRLRPPVAARPDDEGPLGRAVAGFRFLFVENEQVLAAATLTASGLGLGIGAWYTLIVVLCAQSFHLGAQSAGFIDATWAGGGVAGSFLIAWLAPKLRFGGLFMAGAAVSAGSTVLLGLSPAGLLPFVIAGLLGSADILVLVGRTTVLQAATAPELLGRVFSAFEATQSVAMLLGALLVGPLIVATSARSATIMFGLLSLAALLLSWVHLLRLERALGVRIYLRQVPLLASLSRRMIDRLGQCLHYEYVPSDTIVVREGEPGSRLYMIKSGTVEVMAHGSRAQPLIVARLHKLDYFGEIALLHDVPRSATVRAHGPVELYSLDRADVRTLVVRATAMEHALAATARTRWLDTQRRTRVR